MQLIRVIADLETPASVRGGLNLDGLLTHAVAGHLPPNKRLAPDDVEIPVKMLTYKGRSAYMCSDLEVITCTRTGTKITWRNDPVDSELRVKRFNRTSGRLRDTMKPLPLLVAEWVMWDAWADEDAVREIVRGIHSIGGGRAHGYGRVKKWRVNRRLEHPLFTIWNGRTTRRNLPDSWVYGGSPIQTSCRPPYWAGCRQEPCVAAGSTAKLMKGVIREAEEARR